MTGCERRSNPLDSRGPDPDALVCELDLGFLVAGAVRDGIPSLEDPDFVSAADRVPSYLDGSSRVIGLHIDEVSYAIPHNVLWLHEIVNFEAGGRTLAVTYCPLTGSSLAFDRNRIGNATLGVSGLLYQNNLMLYDRNDPSSLWPQMLAEARCGPRSGTTLPQWPVVEMTWNAWLELYPETLVLSEDQGYSLSYTQSDYPYGSYEDYSATFFWIPGAMPPLDFRRPIKERVLGVPPGFGFVSGDEGDPGAAFPFDALAALDGLFQVVDFTYEGRPAVVLWSDSARGGMAFRPATRSGGTVRLVATDLGIEDLNTGSGFTVDGRAISGSLSGTRLVPLERTYVAFWGAWAAFHPETRLWVP